jgi:hypothetical protein
VFYCPQEKPISFEGMLVKAKPLKKLCEFEGRPLPQVKETSFFKNCHLYFPLELIITLHSVLDVEL